MKKDNNNVFVFIIDRGWLTTKMDTEESIEWTFMKLLSEYAEHRYYNKPICIKRISSMEDITGEFQIEDERFKDTIVSFRKDCYEKFNKCFDGLAYNYSSLYIERCIKATTKNTIRIFFVYTETEEEINILYEKYGIVGSIVFLSPNKHSVPDGVREFSLPTIKDVFLKTKQMLTWVLSKAGCLETIPVDTEE